MLKILYEDNHIIAAEKPPGVLSQADSTGDPDMLGILKEYLKVKYEKPGNVFLGLVHRLDRPAGGIMVFARTSKAASRLSSQIRNREFGKEYLAVVKGSPCQGRKVVLRDFIVKDAKENKAAVADETAAGSMEALLEYECIADYRSGNGSESGSGIESGSAKEQLSLVRIVILTGRPHQIRLQMANAGFPLYGDKKYGTYRSAENKNGGSGEKYGSNRTEKLALWACRIAFVHPALKKEIVVTSLPPFDEEIPWKYFEKYYIPITSSWPS